MAKKGEHKQYEATNGQKYTFQHPGLRESIRMRDRAKTETGTSAEALYSEFMEHVVFIADGGRTSWDHFEEHGGLNEVMKAASNFIFQDI
ncbi:hypothetical protein [Metasolibacillus sp.]|uniref:hypothetical protein n=1 Tax=Metasolibacillus sp. TaxID=2703680 RepID=UPI0025E37625|nr:hypothetical protein [Metasolibacillus sp.]MCT6926167.1 hypothetical protein [Metasolibacillus sp.]MCT6942400.1 hypothetical protein [Metasolibacillus sp.]